MRYSNPSHPKKVPRTACLSLHSALEIAREKERGKEKVCDITKEKEKEKYQEVKNEKEKEEVKKNGREKENGKEKVYEKNISKEKSKDKEKVKGKEKDEEKEKERTDELKKTSIRDIKNGSGSHSHIHGASVSTTASTSTGASLASVVWGRRAAAASNTASKPQLEQVHNKSTKLSRFLLHFRFLSLP